jgi:amidase
MLATAASTFVASRPARSQPVSAATETWKMGASELARAIAARRLSSREVVEAHLNRIDAINGQVNAVTSVLREEALAAADLADRNLAGGGAVGPLHGVPMGVKENIDVRGSATTQGARALANALAPVDAPSIAGLRRAGAIPIARTNLPDFGLRWHTDSGLHGATRNPWDGTRTPGGSSGGDAAALASGMIPLGNGNDYGGSLRWPAQCCGITSIRPSRGRVAQASSTSPGDPPLTLQMFAVEGPMARRVEDVRLALEAMSGPDPRDPSWAPAPLEGPAPARPVRVAFTADPGGTGVHPDVADGVRKAARALEQAGYAVEEVEPPAVEEAASLWNLLVTAELRMMVWPSIRDMVSAGAASFMEPFLADAPECTFEQYMSGFAERNRIAREWSLFFERYPLVLGPVSTDPPFLVGLDLEGAEASSRIFRSMRLVVLVNLLGLPAAAVPVGVANGLPLGVQIAGSMYREDLCLDAANAIEEQLGTFTPIEPFPG